MTEERVIPAEEVPRLPMGSVVIGHGPLNHGDVTVTVLRDGKLYAAGAETLLDRLAPGSNWRVLCVAPRVAPSIGSSSKRLKASEEIHRMANEDIAPQSMTAAWLRAHADLLEAKGQ